MMTITHETQTLPPPLCGETVRYRVANDALPGASSSNTLAFAEWTFDALFDSAGLSDNERAAFARSSRDGCRDLAIHPGGWQSWSAGWELMGRERLPRTVALIPELQKLTNRDCEQPPDGNGWITGHFIIYVRAGDCYLCIASAEGGASREGDASGESNAFREGGAPRAPVTFYIHRKKRRIQAEVFAPGRIWAGGQTIAELHIFFAQGFFAFKDALKALYRQNDAFHTLDFLRFPPGEQAPATEPPNKRNLPGGYASWYNHYTDINEDIILEDLDALSKTENLLKLRYIDRKRPLVFQIDDGWQRAVGEWDVDSGRFPRGLQYVARRIEAAGFIPGLWLAPFIVTRRSRIFREKPEWLLTEAAPEQRGRPRGKPVAAGFNPLWDKRYYCLDISRQDVLEYLKALIDRVIDEWGFRYLKLDFLYTGVFAGAFSGGSGGAPHEYYEQACKVLTARTSSAASCSSSAAGCSSSAAGCSSSATGLPVAYLGCGLPLGLSYRRFPLSRTGADTREMWDWKAARFLGHVGRPGAVVNLQDTIGRTHLDGTVYISDPDVIFLRTKNCKLTETEKELIALVNFLLAGQIMFSDDPLHLEAADLTLTRRMNALYEMLESDEYGAVRIGKNAFRIESRSGKIAGLINLNSRPFRLERFQQPELFTALSTQRLLVDHRVRRTAETITFAARSITLG